MKIKKVCFICLVTIFLLAFPTMSAWAAEPSSDGDQEMVTVTADLYQTGALASEASGITAYSLQTEEMERKIYESLNQISPKLDISDWGLTTAQAEDLRLMFERIVNGHPELFYVSNRYSYNFATDSGRITSVTWGYQETDPGRISAMKAAMEAKVSEILARTDSSMADVEKLMVLHEALVTNITYTETTDWNNGKGCYTAYCALVEGRAVCHGYALAFDLLSERLGIQTEFVSSSALNHAWNLVILGGETYHVDCTWDDKDHPGEVFHQNFLLSDAMIKSTGHGTWNDPALSGSGTTYDDYYWRTQAYNYEFFKSGSVWYQAREQGAPEATWRRIGMSLLNPETLSPGPMQEPTVPVSVQYRVHVQSQGWQEPVSDGKIAGTIDLAKRMEAIEIEVAGNPNLGISYQTHVQSRGWQGEVSNGARAGTENQAKRMEAIRIWLTGADAEDYDIYYHVYVQSYGWLGWTKNGENAGTEGLAKRMEAIEIQILEKGSVAPGSTERPFIQVQPTVTYQTHVQTFGWQNPASNGSLAGTTGQTKRMEAIKINLSNFSVSGGIRYQAHTQSHGWQSWVSNGKTAGTSGEAKRMEAIKIELTGEVAAQYDVYYRVHVQSQGWQDWVKNGELAGTVGKAKRMEAIEIRLEKKS